MTKLGGIFCLETSWADDGKDLTYSASVEQQLRMLEGADECGKVIHRDVATRPEFDQYLKEWLRPKYKPYPLAYLAFHGVRGGLMIGDTELTLLQLADMIGPDKASGRIVYFGSCSTMAAHEDELEMFCRNTGVRAIVGYARTVGWRESAAFDCLLVPRLLEMHNMKSVFNSLERDYPEFVGLLGLRIATSKWATDRKIAEKAALSKPV